MIDVCTLDDLSCLAESIELECKLAQGIEGKGELPQSFWQTYSAFANTRGGIILLGIREHHGRFTAEGIFNPKKIRTELFNLLNSPEKVSINLLTDSDVSERLIDGKKILMIKIPRASRKQRPIFINGNPLKGTYRRLDEGDRHCNEETVKRMLAEQMEDDRDAKILPGFGMDEIDMDSLRIYRQMLRDEKLGHPYLDWDDFGLLQSLGGWRQDRQTSEEGLTLAGLLMFGKWPAIQEALPNYFVDYQERPDIKTELRWVDRLVPDGTWTGNLFEFYRRIYRKLAIDLKVPFSLKGDRRQDDTPAHEALREALVNTLVHADYTGRISVLIVKRPNMFSFRNPGGLRLPLEQVIRGGESDCRNRILHQMFLLIGLGERSGSGIPKIYSGWKKYWRPPILSEKDDPEQTLLELHMLDLLPDFVIQELRERFGQKFDILNPTERLLVATAHIEQVVNHTRLLEICNLHSHDLSLCLARLERSGFLASDGQTRGKVYHLPGIFLPSPEQIFPDHLLGSGHNDPSSGHNDPSSGHNDPSSGHNGLNFGSGSDTKRDEYGCLFSKHLDAPVVDDLTLLSPTLRSELETITLTARQKARLSPEEIEKLIIAACKNRYLTLNVLSQLVNRHPDSLRKRHLQPLVKTKLVRQAFPATPTHEKQAYQTVP